MEEDQRCLKMLAGLLEMIYDENERYRGVKEIFTGVSTTTVLRTRGFDKIKRWENAKQQDQLRVTVCGTVKRPFEIILFYFSLLQSKRFSLWWEML